MYLGLITEVEIISSPAMALVRALHRLGTMAAATEGGLSSDGDPLQNLQRED